MLTLEQLQRIQQRVAERTGGEAGVRDIDSLRRVQMRPLAQKRGIPQYPTLFNQVAALMQGIAFEKPFVSSNRRTAFLAAACALRQRGWRLQANADDLARVMKGIELGITTWHRITVWLKGNVERTGRRGKTDGAS